MMKKYLINEMLRICRRGLNKHHELLNFPHYSFILSNSQIIEYAENANLEPRRHLGYHHPKRSASFRPKFHSEVWAYYRSRGLLGNRKFEVVNFRFNKQGEIKLAKPCEVCYNLLSILGATKFYYSSGLNEELLQIKGKV